MRITLFLLCGALGLGILSLTGCNGDSEVALAPSFPEGTGQEPAGAKPYPNGPYGVAKGSVIANYKFVGYPNALKDSETLQEIELAEFYNPTADTLYEEGSVMEVGTPKPTALLLTVSAIWCGPCNYEADKVFPGLYEDYKPKGGEFFVQLADGATPGKAANAKALRSWTDTYEVDYPMAIDPSYQLGALFEADAFPANMVIDTRTMRIVEVTSGAPEPGSSFWKTFENVIEGQD